MVSKGICRTLFVLLFCSLSQGQAMESNGTSLNEIPVCDDVVERILLFALGSENPGKGLGSENPAKTLGREHQAKILANLSLVSKSFQTNVSNIYEKYFPGLKEKELKRVYRESLETLIMLVDLPHNVCREEELNDFLLLHGCGSIEIIAPAYGIAKSNSLPKKDLNKVLVDSICRFVAKAKKEYSTYPGRKALHGLLVEVSEEEDEKLRRSEEWIKECIAHLRRLGENGCLDAIKAVVQSEKKEYFLEENMPSKKNERFDEDSWQEKNIRYGLTPIEEIIVGAFETLQVEVIAYFFDVDVEDILNNKNIFLYDVFHENDFQYQWITQVQCFDEPVLFERKGTQELIKNHFENYVKKLKIGEESSESIFYNSKIFHSQLITVLVYCNYKQCVKTYKEIFNNNKLHLEKKDVRQLARLNKKLKGPQELTFLLEGALQEMQEKL